jgi:hypothetical protein
MNVESKIRKETMTNRYGDEFVFTLLEDGNIHWDGKFEYVRVGFPNDYTESYKAYTNLGGLMGFKEFKEEVHRSIYDENDNYVGPCDINRVYGPMVKSKKDVINMVDPSGGPYMNSGTELMGKTIKEFKSNKEGYLIITK